jgi:nitrite reductase (NO-forming)
MAADPDSSVRRFNPRRPTWPIVLLRVSIGLVWAIDASFKWTPTFRSSYASTLTDAAKDQPGWLHWWFTFWVNLQSPHPIFFAYLVAVVETLLAFMLVFGFARKVAYVGGAVYGFLLWGTAEGFGGPYSPASTDIGTGIIYVIVFFALLALSDRQGAEAWSLDALIDRGVGWWHWVADVGGHRSRTGLRSDRQAEQSQ